MTMTLDENTVGIWYISLSEDEDWLMTVNQTKDEYTMKYRFRYYEDDSCFDSNDRKSWYSGVMPKDKITLEELIEKMRVTVTMMGKMRGVEDYYELLMGDGNLKQFMKEFMELPFVHAREPTEEEKRQFNS